MRKWRGEYEHSGTRARFIRSSSDQRSKYASVGGKDLQSVCRRDLRGTPAAVIVSATDESYAAGRRTKRSNIVQDDRALTPDPSHSADGVLRLSPVF